MSDEGVTRRLTTIVALDVAGYSRLMGADEENTLVALSAHRRDLIDPSISEHGGRIANTAGDSILAEFPSVIEALRCSINVQQAMAERNRETPADRRIEFRIGINVGDVLEQDGDLFGDGVNVAARLEGLADAGGICLSRAARDQVRDRMDVALVDMGEVEVKNIARPVRAFRVSSDSGEQQQRPARRGRPVFVASAALTGLVLIVLALAIGFWQWGGPAPGVAQSSLTAEASIAVLPFSNLSGAVDDDYFADGVTRELITALSKFHELFVISSNSVFPFKGQAVDLKQVGRELGVRYLLQGSVQKAGRRVRINTQLVEADSGRNLWAERFDEASSNLFDLQDRITKNIVRTLAVKISDVEQERAFAKQTEDLEAYDLVQRGRQLLWTLRRSENFRARDLFRKAIALDPDFVAAYVGLGRTYLSAVEYGWTGAPQKAMQQAHELAQRAIALDASNASAHRLAGEIYLTRRQYDLALLETEHAIALNPNDALNHSKQGIVLLYSGRPDGALLALETARRFDPLMDPAQLTHLGLAYYLKERYVEAARVLERCVALNPDYLYGQTILAATFGQLGSTDHAARAATEVRRLDPFFRTNGFGGLFRDAQYRDMVVAGLRKAGFE